MIHVLSTMLTSYIQRPSMKQCSIVAESLLAKFSFLKESVSLTMLHHYNLQCILHAQNSWKHFLYTRSQNVNRNKIINCDKSEAPCLKRMKMEPSKHVYAAFEPSDDSDEVSNKRNLELLIKMLKPKPKSEVVLHLIQRTFVFRRKWIMDGARPQNVVTDYPHLKKCCYVSVLCRVIFINSYLRCFHLLDFPRV